MSKFFDQVYGGGSGHVFICGRDDEGNLNIERDFSWPAEKGNIDKYVKARWNEDVYYSVSMFSGKRRRKIDDGAQSKIVWADADVCPPSAFRLEPSIVVQTSPAHSDSEPCGPRDRSGVPCQGHFHVIWVLDHMYPAVDAAEAAQRIFLAHKDQGCDHHNGVTKILRVPGTVNTKWEPPFEITEAQFSDKVYSLEEIVAAYNDVAVDVREYSNMEMPKLVSEGEPEFIDLEKYVVDAGLSNIYLEAPKNGQSWSERAYKFQMELFRFGCTPEEVFSLSWNAACNKYHPKAWGKQTQTGVVIPERQHPEAVLWDEVQKSHSEYLTEVPAIAQGVAEETPVTATEFLTIKEKELVLDNPTFIDQYVSWALSKSPDHAEVYSRSLAWEALSAAYADRCFVKPKWRRQRTNLWTMVLGDSTRTHKSAARDIFMDFVRGIEDQDMTEIYVGYDTTPEALIKVLGERNNQTSLICTDEINAFFQEATVKQYRSGTFGTYTKLYDGEVPRTLRIGKDSGNNRNAETSFLLVGVGIFDEVASTLTRQQFASGFLLRTTWAIADPPPYRPGDFDWENGDPEAVKTDYVDPVFRDMLKEVIKQRSRYSAEMPKVLLFAPDALRRLNKFTDSVQRLIMQENDPIMEAGVTRLRDHVVRAAALLSYHHGLDEIGMFELLVAIKQGELWLRDYRRMIGAVSSSAFANQCDDMEIYIRSGKGGRRTEAAVMKRFPYKMREFDEIVQALSRQGRIRKNKEHLEALG